MWLARVHPEDRDNVRAELDMVINGTWHFHYMQYRVMDATGKYVLCDCTGYRLTAPIPSPACMWALSSTEAWQIRPIP